MRVYQWRKHVSDELIAAQFMEHEKKKKKKKKDKVRSAWISFAAASSPKSLGQPPPSHWECWCCTNTQGRKHARRRRHTRITWSRALKSARCAPPAKIPS